MVKIILQLIVIEVTDQGVTADVNMLNLLLLKLFVLFVVVSQCRFDESTPQNQKYFKKQRIYGKNNYAYRLGC